MRGSFNWALWTSTTMSLLFFLFTFLRRTYAREKWFGLFDFFYILYLFDTYCLGIDVFQWNWPENILRSIWFDKFLIRIRIKSSSTHEPLPWVAEICVTCVPVMAKYFCEVLSLPPHSIHHTHCPNILPTNMVTIQPKKRHFSFSPIIQYIGHSSVKWSRFFFIQSKCYARTTLYISFHTIHSYDGRKAFLSFIEC